MKDIIVKLLAIYHYAKDIHYSASGENFYATHLLMDRICEDIHSQIDDIFEICYLGTGKLTPTSFEILKIATATIPETISLSLLEELIKDTISAIEDSKRQYLSFGGEVSLLDDIQKTLIKKRGLLIRTNI